VQVEEAQREVRTVFLGGFIGQLVSGALWILSAVLSTWSSPRQGILTLVLGGALIFPVTTLVLKLMGRRASLSQENPMGLLATQIAFTVPLNLPVVAGAALYRLEWFYPACMIVVGTHYLPFIHLYGMKLFGVLAAVLISGGMAMALAWNPFFAAGGWLTGAVLLVFAFALRASVRSELARQGA